MLVEQDQEFNSDQHQSISHNEIHGCALSGCGIGLDKIKLLLQDKSKQMTDYSRGHSSGTLIKGRIVKSANKTSH